MATKQIKATKKAVKGQRKAVRSKSTKARRPVVQGKNQASLNQIVANVAEKTGRACPIRLFMTGRSPLLYGVSLKEPREVLEHRAREGRLVAK